MDPGLGTLLVAKLPDIAPPMHLVDDPDLLKAGELESAPNLICTTKGQAKFVNQTEHSLQKCESRRIMG